MDITQVSEQVYYVEELNYLSVPDAMTELRRRDINHMVYLTKNVDRALLAFATNFGVQYSHFPGGRASHDQLHVVRWIIQLGRSVLFVGIEEDCLETVKCI